MENFNTGTYDMYKDISARTNGEIYIGVIGAVRTGKSSFIKRFMELMVLPFMEDENSRQRAVDEMPQAAQGKTIMTTEPKFIPKDAAKIRLGEDTEVKVRLIDCVGYMVEGATGHLENGVELHAIFQMSGGTLYHITHTVNQPHFYFGIFAQPDFCSIFWNKLRLCCHNGFSLGRLWHFIHRTLAAVFILHKRKYHQLHETFDKR